MNRRRLASLMAVSAIVIGMFGLTTGTALAYTPGDNGKPTSGEQTDLKGRAADVALSFPTGTLTINCTGDNTTQQFNMTLDYTISGAALPAGSTVVVYLSPNGGAINNNAAGDDAGYIATVESNFIALNFAGKSGSGSVSFAIPTGSPFKLDGGGVLGVIAKDVDGTTYSSKTNSINCGEALGTPGPTEEVTAPPTQPVTAPPTQPQVTPSFEQSQAPATDTPAPPVPTPSFEQSQAGETDIATEPNTATVDGNGGSGPGTNAWLLVLALGLLLGSVVVMTPAPSKTRR